MRSDRETENYQENGVMPRTKCSSQPNIPYKYIVNTQDTLKIFWPAVLSNPQPNIMAMTTAHAHYILELPASAPNAPRQSWKTSLCWNKHQEQTMNSAVTRRKNPWSIQVTLTATTFPRFSKHLKTTNPCPMLVSASFPLCLASAEDSRPDDNSTKLGNDQTNEVPRTLTPGDFDMLDITPMASKLGPFAPLWTWAQSPHFWGPTGAGEIADAELLN